MRHTSMTLGVVIAAMVATSACGTPAVDEGEAPAMGITGDETGVPIFAYDPTWLRRAL